MSDKSRGTVKWFNTEKSYGFIINDDGEDVMVHYRSIMANGFRNLSEGQYVEFKQVRSEKGWQAAEVEVIETALAEGGYNDIVMCPVCNLAKPFFILRNPHIVCSYMK